VTFSDEILLNSKHEEENEKTLYHLDASYFLKLPRSLMSTEIDSKSQNFDSHK